MDKTKGIIVEISEDDGRILDAGIILSLPHTPGRIPSVFTPNDYQFKFLIILYHAVLGVTDSFGIEAFDTRDEMITTVKDTYDTFKKQAIAAGDRIPCLMVIDADALTDIRRDGASRHRHRIHYQAGVY